MDRKRVGDSFLASSPANKKQNINGAFPQAGHNGEMLSADDLKDRLAFSQDRGHDAKEGIQAVKTFIENGREPGSKHLKPAVLKALTVYLWWAVPSEVTESELALPDVLRTWSFASMTNDDTLFSLITSLLASLLHTMSSELTLRSQGTAICQTLIYNSQVKLLEKGISARGKGRMSMNTSSLRLLTEITTFDGGALSRSVYRNRKTLFTPFDEFLVPGNKQTTAKQREHNLELRQHALAFLLANLRVQYTDAKVEILSDRRHNKAIFNFIEEDRDPDIVALLQTLDAHFLSDQQVSRSDKSSFLSDTVLSKLATLMRRSGEQYDSGMSVAKCARELLTKACCTPGHGLLIRKTSWYEPGADKSIKVSNLTSESQQHGRFVSQESYPQRFSITNTKLAFFIQDLKPYKYQEHLDLIISVFKAAPDLVADYFLRKKSLSFEPKHTNTWIGYAGLLLSVTRLEVPSFDPVIGLPNPSVVVENLLPCATSRKAFNKCLNLGSFTAFTASKIVTLALMKLSKVLEAAQKVSNVDGSRSWFYDVLQRFSERCPDIQTVVTCVKQCPKANSQLRESLYQLLSLLQRHLLDNFLDAKLDVAEPLANTLAEDGTPDAFRSLVIQHLSDLAHSSTVEFKWFHKPDAMALSPFSSIMQLMLRERNSRLDAILESILVQNCILQSVTSVSAWNVLCQTLAYETDFEHVVTFIDNCFRRFIQKPVMYQSETSVLLESLGGSGHILSLFTAVVAEQWHLFLRLPRSGDSQNVLIEPHVEKDVLNLLGWVARWLSATCQIGESQAALEKIRDTIVKSLPKGSASRKLMKTFILQSHFEIKRTADSNGDVEVSKTVDPLGRAERAKKQVYEELNASTSLGKTPNNFPELLRWSHKEIPDAVEDGHIGALMRCLCVPDQSVRSQAQSQLKQLASKVQASDYSEKQQLHLLLMELIETSTQRGLEEPLPSFTGALAASMVDILNSPTHAVYPKINIFLIRAPEWDPGHLPAYWKDKVLFKKPSHGDGAVTEAVWFAELLFQGLKTPRDLDIYRRRKIFDTIMLRYEHFGLDFKELVTRILWRCTHIEGGSTTLVTRCSILDWTGQMNKEIGLKALQSRVLETCDKKRVEEWSRERVQLRD